MVCTPYKNFVMIGSVVSKLFDFFVVQAWKSYSRPQNWGLAPQNLGEHRSDSPKAHPYMERHILSPQLVQV